MNMRNGSNAGMILAGIGGIIAMIGLAVFFDSNIAAGTTIARLGIILLIAAMFFALSGAFSKTGQWTAKGLTFFAFLTTAVVAGATLAGIIDVYFGAIEIVVAVLVIVFSYLPATQLAIAKE